MRKKILMALLVTAMTVCVFAGCGKRIEGDVQAAMADAGGSQEKDDGIPESGADGTETVEPTSEPTEEPEPEETAEPTAEPGAEAEDALEETDEEEEATERELTDEEIGDRIVKHDKNGYSFAEMKETMYAKSSVNVRDLPSKDGKKLDKYKLTAGQEVTVTGQCVETGWYRLEIDKKVVYVSDSYIVSEKPSTGSGATGNSGSTGTGSSQNTTNSGKDSTGTGSSQNTTNSGKDSTGTGSSQNTGKGGSDSQGSGESTGKTGTQGTQTSTSSGQSSAFVDYLNQKRAEAGLQQISWDSSLASEAQKRAEAVVSNFSHDGSGNYLENLYQGPSSSYTDWYTAWYNSSGHRATMMHENLVKGGCAFVEVNGTYYVVFVAKYEVPVMSADEWNDYKEEAVASGEMKHEQVTNDAGATVDVYIEGDGGVVTDQETNDAIEQALRDAGLIP